jgi:hypothetical protein
LGARSRESIERKIRTRIDAYDEAWRAQLEPWWRDGLLPVLDGLHIACVSLESVVLNITSADPEFGGALGEFYDRCVRFNRVEYPEGRTGNSHR